MNWQPVFENWPTFLSGLATTLALFLCALVFGFAISIPLAILRCSRRKWLAIPVAAYTFLIRGSPLLAQIFLIYYGLGQFYWIRETSLWTLFSSATFCATLALTQSTAAYTTEIFSGALKNLPQAEVEAAQSYGMLGLVLYRRIIIPGFLRRCVPQYGNEVIMVLHATALASTVTLLDLTGSAQLINARFYTSFEPLAVVGAIYLALTFIITLISHKLDQRWGIRA